MGSDDTMPGQGLDTLITTVLDTLGVTGVLAVELASRGIRVNQINPGAVDTEGARAIGAMSDEARATHVARTPLGRVGTPADIASVAVFLASDAAGWLTGECLAVSGGLR